MNRMNSLLRASLENHVPMVPTDPMASMEDYVTYRNALEEYREAVVAVDQVSDISEGISEIESAIDESREAGEPMNDQIAMQIDAINAVRAVVDGDMAEVSMESFDSILQISLEASNASDGILKRMWEAFKAMVKRIANAIKGMWNWITGGKKRTAEAAKEVKGAAAHATATRTTIAKPETAARVAKVKVAAQAVGAMTNNLRVILADVKKMTDRDMKVIMNNIGSSGTGDRAADERLLECIRNIEFANRAITAIGIVGDDKSVPLADIKVILATPGMAFAEIGNIMDGHTASAEQIITMIQSLDGTIDAHERTLNSKAFQDGVRPEEVRAVQTAWRQRFADIQRLRGTMVDMLNTVDRFSLAARVEIAKAARESDAKLIENSRHRARHTSTPSDTARQRDQLMEHMRQHDQIQAQNQQIQHQQQHMQQQQQQQQFVHQHQQFVNHSMGF